jgi:creatinine amidohydrolase/Fe(II)-dependent formamide hydrolase-like protein
VPDLEVGVEPVNGPGTRLVPYEAVLDLVLRACDSVVKLGAQRVVLQTFHGSPLHDIALERAAQWLRAQGVPAVVPLNYLIHTFIEADPSTYDAAYATIEDRALRDELQRDFVIDFHAGFVETSLTLHYAPDSVDPRHVGLPRCPRFDPEPRLLRASRAALAMGRKHLAAELSVVAFGLGWHALRPFPGYSGHPAVANARAGQAFAKVLVDALMPLVSNALDGRPPPIAAPIPWLHYASAKGRLGNVSTPLEQVITRFP